ncbi:MAG: hypothetical protein HOV81_29805 [Kofleriaceae bacterium]|nr:hypothetical protein [Kofleriaceae bacterium]
MDRAIGSARKTVGSQHAPVLDVPASLDPLRDVLARGNTREIIDALSAPQHDDNPDAQLVLARFLALDGELGRASGIYHRLAEGPDPHRRRALVGKAGLLLQLGLLDSALALFDGVCAEAPSDLDASEGRAQALERLGRLGEAAAEYRRFVGLANARADLRVRVAQQWLDAHVL